MINKYILCRPTAKIGTNVESKVVNSGCVGVFEFFQSYIPEQYATHRGVKGHHRFFLFQFTMARC